MAQNTIDVVIRGVNRASTAIKEVKGDLAGLDDVAKTTSSGLSGLFSAATVAAIGAAAIQVGEVVVELGNLGQQVQQQRAYFEVWSGGVANATENLNAMRAAIGNVMTDSEAMASANKLLSMGLARNSTELANLSRMAVMLGGSTRTAQESIEEFSLLLANQSILRLDTFGISGARVRERIEELQAADEDLTREQAFLNAVMEEGARKVDALAAAGVDATTAAQDLDTAFRGLKEAIGVGLSGPIAEAQSNLATTLNQLAALVRGTSILNDVLTLDPGSEAQLVSITQRLEYLRDLVERSASGENIYRFNAENALKEIAELESRLIALTPVNEDVAASAGIAAVRMVDAMRDVEGAVEDVHSTLSETTHWDKFVALGQAAANRIKSEMLIARAAGMGLLDAAATTTGTFTDPSKTRWGLYTDWAKRQSTGLSQSNADSLVQDWITRVTDANTETATDFSSKYSSAIDDLSGDIESALSKGIANSKSLLDLTGMGGGDIFAPGANGPFENIYRALDVAKLGAASPWAAALGLTQEDARRISADFQRGLFTEEVQGLINVDQLLGQIQSEQDAAASGAKFAQMLAGRLGVKDAGALVASQTFQAIAGGIDADPTQQQDAAQRVLDAYLGNVETVVTGKDYAGRMIGFGSTTWVYYESGLLEGAKASTVFARAVDAAIGAWMARQAAPKQPQGVVGAAAAMGVTP